MRLQLSKSFAEEFESSVFSGHDGARVHGDAGDQKVQSCWLTTKYILPSVCCKIKNSIKYFHIYFHLLKISVKNL